jgi:hypothetical protein
MADEGWQDLLQLEEEALAGGVSIGEHGEGDPSRPPLTQGRNSPPQNSPPKLGGARGGLKKRNGSWFRPPLAPPDSGGETITSAAGLGWE